MPFLFVCFPLFCLLGFFFVCGFCCFFFSFDGFSVF